MLTLVMEHYNDVAATLFERPERYAPLFAVDPNSGEILWECWIEGFEKAVKLRPHAWRGCLDADRETAVAMSGLLTLADVARADPRFSQEQIDAITANAHERIGDWVVTLNEWRLANDAPPNIPAPLATARPFPKSGSQRPLSLRLGKEIQTMLRPQLNRGRPVELAQEIRTGCKVDFLPEGGQDWAADQERRRRRGAAGRIHRRSRRRWRWPL